MVTSVTLAYQKSRHVSVRSILCKGPASTNMHHHIMLLPWAAWSAGSDDTRGVTLGGAGLRPSLLPPDIREVPRWPHRSLKVRKHRAAGKCRLLEITRQLVSRTSSATGHNRGSTTLEIVYGLQQNETTRPKSCGFSSEGRTGNPDRHSNMAKQPGWSTCDKNALGLLQRVVIAAVDGGTRSQQRPSRNSALAFVGARYSQSLARRDAIIPCNVARHCVYTPLVTASSGCGGVASRWRRLVVSEGRGER